jgi:hypothetical protein
MVAQALLEKATLDSAVAGITNLFNRGVDLALDNPYPSALIALVIVVFLMSRRR